MTLHTPAWMQDATYSAFHDRQVLDAALGAGVVAVGDLKVSQRGAGANMTVDVAAGRVVIPGPSGRYVGFSDAVTSVAVGAAPSVGNVRIDLVIARARDSQAMGTGSVDDWVIEVVAGTAAADPSPPATPPYAVALGRVRLVSSTGSITNGIITDVRMQSISPAQLAWPRISIVDLPDATATATAANWGAGITFASLVPNRPVRVCAWVDGSFVPAAAGSTGADLGIQIATGATVVQSKSAYGLGDNAFLTTPISKAHMALITPAAGATLVVQARIRSSSGVNASFTRGELFAQVFPA